MSKPDLNLLLSALGVTLALEVSVSTVLAAAAAFVVARCLPYKGP